MIHTMKRVQEHAISVPVLATQELFLQAVINGTAQYVAYIGGVGSGKTIGASIGAIFLSLMFPNNRGVVCNATDTQLEDTTEFEFFQTLQRMRLSHLIVKRVDSRGRKMVQFNNGSVVLFRSCDKPERLQSLTLGWFWMDEAGTCKPRAFNVLCDRLRLWGRKEMANKTRFHIGMMTSNPQGLWLERQMRELAKTGRSKEFHAGTAENWFKDSSYHEDVKIRYGGEDSSYYQRMGRGQWTRFEGLVYPFDEATHKIKPFDVPRIWAKFEGIDFGFSNPFCALLMAYDGESIYVIGEHYERQRLLDYHAAQVLAMETRYPFDLGLGPLPLSRFADPAAASDRAGLAKSIIAGRRVTTIAADNDVMQGIYEVVNMMTVRPNGRPRLYIFDTCVNLLREISVYAWSKRSELPDQTRGVNYDEIESPAGDHACDALRYGVFGFMRYKDHQGIYAAERSA